MDVGVVRGFVCRVRVHMRATLPLHIVLAIVAHNLASHLTHTSMMIPTTYRTKQFICAFHLRLLHLLLLNYYIKLAVDTFYYVCTRKITSLDYAGTLGMISQRVKMKNISR